jgi:hypothetical protein
MKEKILFGAQKRLETARIAATDADRPKSDLRKHIGELVGKLKNYQPSHYDVLNFISL